MFVATQYIRLGKAVLVRGEELPENVERKKLEWLLESGAIKEIDPVTFAPVDTKDQPVEDESEDESVKEVIEEAEEEIQIDVMEGLVEEDPKPKKRGRKKAE